MVCPKCSSPIKWYDLSPNCKNCGVHIMYFTQKEDLARDAKKTELEFAKAHTFTAKLKAAFISDRFAITNMIFTILSVAALCIPFDSVLINIPYWSSEISLGAIGIYNMYSNGILLKIFDFFSVGVANNIVLLAVINIISFIIITVLVLIILITYLCSFINIHRATKVICILSACAGAFDIICIILQIITSYKTIAYSFLSVSNGFGAYILLAMLIVLFCLNLVIHKANKSPLINDLDLKRIETANKIKSGQLNIDDLPLPVYQTEEERLKRQEAYAAAFSDKSDGGNDNEE